ncbi:hypothetical protein KY343_01805 [Candidatus Woesearchaeota archaeon]|nr:hypothetical protein [Candidatus Woesearchaeota archaeon]
MDNEKRPHKQIEELVANFKEVKRFYDQGQFCGGIATKLEAEEGVNIIVQYDNRKGHAFCFSARCIAVSPLSSIEYESIVLDFSEADKDRFDLRGMDGKVTATIPVDKESRRESPEPNFEGNLYSQFWEKDGIEVLEITYQSKELADQYRKAAKAFGEKKQGL